MPQEDDAIFDAIRNSDLDTVRSVLAADPTQVNARDESGWTPLYGAVSEGYTEVAKLLLAKGANVNAGAEGGWTPLHRAAIEGHTEVAKLLLAKGANVNAGAEGGWTPLRAAVFHNYVEVAELLIAKGADVNAKDEHGMTPLYFAADLAIMHAEQYREGMIELLLAEGADANTERGESGLTPLHRAAEFGRIEVAKLLIAGGAYVNARTKDGRTPLSFVDKGFFSFGQDTTMKLFLKHHGATK